MLFPHLDDALIYRDFFFRKTICSVCCQHPCPICLFLWDNWRKRNSLLFGTLKMITCSVVTVKLWQRDESIAARYMELHAYTVYTPIGGKGRCHTSCDLQDHSTQARKSAGEISTLDLKPMRKDTRSPKTGAIIGSSKWTSVQTKIKKKNRYMELN